MKGWLRVVVGVFAFWIASASHASAQSAGDVIVDPTPWTLRQRAVRISHERALQACWASERTTYFFITIDESGHAGGFVFLPQASSRFRAWMQVEVGSWLFPRPDRPITVAITRSPRGV